jgi:hypothetical protein
MRVTINLDDKLVERACELAGIDDVNALATAALQALVERESALRLARLGGTERELHSVERRGQRRRSVGRRL